MPFFTLYSCGISLLIIFISRILYIIIYENRQSKKTAFPRAAKTLIILGSGGHTTEMLQVIQHLNPANYSPRIYTIARSDKISEHHTREVETGRNDYEFLRISSSREVGQSYITSIFTTLRAIFETFPLIWKVKPDLVLCNGPGKCVPICLVTFLFKVIFLSEAKIVFIESFCRVKSFSLSGKLLYFLVNRVIVQWPYLNKPPYVRNVFIE